MVQLEEHQVEVPTPSLFHIRASQAQSAQRRPEPMVEMQDSCIPPHHQETISLICSVILEGYVPVKGQHVWLLSNFFTLLSKKTAQAAQSAISCGHQNHVLVKTPRSPFDCRDIRRQRLNSWLEKDRTPLPISILTTCRASLIFCL